MRDVVTQDRALRVLGKGNKERLAYVPAGARQRLQIWIDEIRGETPGPLFTRIRRFGDVTLNRLTDRAVYHILQVRQWSGRHHEMFSTRSEANLRHRDAG